MTDKPVAEMSFEEAMAALEGVVSTAGTRRSGAGAIHRAV